MVWAEFGPPRSRAASEGDCLQTGPLAEVIKLKPGHWGGPSPTEMGSLKEEGMRTQTRTEGPPRGDTREDGRLHPTDGGLGGAALPTPGFIYFWPSDL